MNLILFWFVNKGTDANRGLKSPVLICSGKSTMLARLHDAKDVVIFLLFCYKLKLFATEWNAVKK